MALSVVPILGAGIESILLPWIVIVVATCFTMTLTKLFGEIDDADGVSLRFSKRRQPVFAPREIPVALGLAYTAAGGLFVTGVPPASRAVAISWRESLSELSVNEVMGTPGAFGVGERTRRRFLSNSD